LCFDSIHGRAIEALNSQMLFDPFEKDLHPPPVSIQLSNCYGWQSELIGKKDE
jgi:hypothetical protein